MSHQTSYTLHFRTPGGDLQFWEQYGNSFHDAGEAFKVALGREYPDGKGGTAATWILLRKTEKDPLEQALKSIETGTLALRATLKSQVQLADALEKAVRWHRGSAMERLDLLGWSDEAETALREAGRR